MRILAVSAHPDDETFGVGGTLLKHRARGDSLSWINVTTGAPGDFDAAHLAGSQDQVEAASSFYGYEQHHQLGLPSTRLDALPLRDVIGPLMNALRQVRPDVVYTVSDADVHTDHHVVFEALMLALKPFRTDMRVAEIYAYETLSSTEAGHRWRRPFVPDTFSDITPHLEEKIAAVQIYANQLQPEPLPRSESSVRALARLRGATIGVAHAEALSLVRKVW